MNRMLIRKYFGESWLLWSACAFALFSFAWVRVWIAGLFEYGEVRDILERFKRFERFSPIPFDQLSSYEGRVGISFDEPLVLMCILIWGIARGSDVVSGELNRGTLEMLLGQPVARVRMLWLHGVVTVTGLIGLVFLHWCGMWCGIQTTTVVEAPPAVKIEIPGTGLQIPLTSPGEPVEVALSERVDPLIFLAASANLFAFGWLLLGLAVGVSCCDRYRWRTVGVAVALHIMQVVLYGLSRATDKLQTLKYWTYCSCYRPQELTQLALREGTYWAPWRLWDANGWPLGPLAFTLGMLVLGTLFWVGGLWVFRRRDLPAPL